MRPYPEVSSVAFLISDPARAAILMSLLDGRAWPAGELAHVAGVTAQTASAHLAKLLTGGLLSVETQGRHRYYRLAGAHVAMALENLASICPAETSRRMPVTRGVKNLRFARCCYDHLAGQLGMALTRALQARGIIVAAADKKFDVPAAGKEWFGRIGLDMDRVKPTRLGLARQCLDWSERDHHLAGPLGVQLLALLCSNGWLRRSPSSRAVEVTPPGWAWLKAELDIDERTVVEAI
jgi:DNA-binding transcriptional ArsR family regulator